eukprot:6186447-Pleurochrysis_carterae.AAC.3
MIVSPRPPWRENQDRLFTVNFVSSCRTRVAWAARPTLAAVAAAASHASPAFIAAGVRRSRAICEPEIY